MNKLNKLQIGISALSDNSPLDCYFYQITLFTGHRKNAGTQSQVNIEFF